MIPEDQGTISPSGYAVANVIGQLTYHGRARVYPNIVNDGQDHHQMAANRYLEHLDKLHGIGATQLKFKHLPGVKGFLDLEG